RTSGGTPQTTADWRENGDSLRCTGSAGALPFYQNIRNGNRKGGVRNLQVRSHAEQYPIAYSPAEYTVTIQKDAVMEIVFVESIFTEQFLNNSIMDNNQFKRSQDFSNIESNKANSPNQSMEEYNKKAQEYLREMRSRNEEATRDGFLNTMKNASPPDAWENQHKAYDDAWENNKNYQ